MFSCKPQHKMHAMSETPKKLTCKRPPSPKCSTSRMLSDCMKAVEREENSHEVWVSENKAMQADDLSSLCASGSLGVYQILTKLPIRQHKGLTRQRIIYSNFAIIHRLRFQSWWRKAQGLQKQRLPGNVLGQKWTWWSQSAFLSLRWEAFTRVFKTIDHFINYDPP